MVVGVIGWAFTVDNCGPSRPYTQSPERFVAGAREAMPGRFASGSLAGCCQE